jgi:DNA polymerase
MSAGYEELLEATIQHLEELKGRGVRFVSASPEALAGLAKARSKKTGFVARTPEVREHRPEPFKPIGSVVQIEQRPALAAPVQKIENSPAPVLTPEAKAAAFADLRQRAMVCVKCSHLASSRKNVVFGVGDINAQLMFVGEAPGLTKIFKGSRLWERPGSC